MTRLISVLPPNPPVPVPSPIHRPDRLPFDHPMSSEGSAGSDHSRPGDDPEVPRPPHAPTTSWTERDGPARLARPGTRDRGEGHRCKAPPATMC